MRYVDCRTSKQIKINSPQRALNLAAGDIQVGNAANIYTTIFCFTPGIASIPLDNTGVCLLREGSFKHVTNRGLYNNNY